MDDEVYRIPHRRMANGWTGPVYQHMGDLSQEKALGFNGELLQAQSRGRVAKLMPGVFLESHFQRTPQRQSDVNFLRNIDHVENKPVSAHHTVTMVSAYTTCDFFGCFEIVVQKCRSLGRRIN